MRAFDTDILTELLRGTPKYVELAQAIPIAEWAAPIVVAQEIIDGRLEGVRKAEQGKGRIAVERAYFLFQETLDKLRSWTFLPYTRKAEGLFSDWRRQKIGNKTTGTHDLRIAAICVVHSARLVSRNRQDFEGIPGLDLDAWT
jgi:tRNA(fMet)-specific endonuclease VapC